MELRNYIQRLYENNLLHEIREEVDWKYEIGDISRHNKNNALLFHTIKDYKEFSLFTGGLASCEHFSILLKMPLTNKKKNIIHEIKKRMVKPYEPLLTNSLSNKYIWTDGRDVNLYDLPAPWWHPGDGGRYIGTWHVNISNDPQTMERNVGVYRMQIKGRNYTTVSISPKSHLAEHINKAERKNLDLPLAVAIGIDETVMIAAASASPEKTDEYNFAGAIQKGPLKIVKCKTVDLEVPLNAEIVLEGVVRCGIRMQDGPYFDYSGKLNVNKHAYCFEVRAIRRKVDAIFRGMSVGEPGAEDHLLFSILADLHMADFHGSGYRQNVQNILLKAGFFRTFQLFGRIGNLQLLRRN
jgi:4-hydroxy-3-polyprenylbenzoate decarboxylase